MSRRKKHHKPKGKPTEQVFRISELGWHGDGVGEVNGKRVFVPFTLAGETVRALVRGNRGELLEVLEPAAERISPVCPHFSRCGGCAVQHLEETSYAQWKRGMVEVALSNRDIHVPVNPLREAHGEGRRRVTLHARFERDGVQVGFMQAHSHRLVDLQECPKLSPGLKSVFDVARALAKPFAGKPKPLDIQITETESGLDCDIRGAGELDLNARMDLSEIANDFDLSRVTADKDMVLERRPPVLTFGAAKVTLPPAGFLQATKAGEEALSELVIAAVGNSSRVADLYSGIGPFSLRLASRCSISAYDNDEAAIGALNNAAHHTQKIKPVTADVRDLTHNPLHADELDNFDAVIFDPPRAGAPSQAEEISGSGIPLAVAVSCNPATFAQDAATLVQGGFTLERVTPVDQFRYAGHVELVGVFRR